MLHSVLADASFKIGLLESKLSTITSQTSQLERMLTLSTSVAGPGANPRASPHPANQPNAARDSLFVHDSDDDMIDAADGQVKSEVEARVNFAGDADDFDEQDESAEETDNEECEFAEGEKLDSAHIVARQVDDLVGTYAHTTSVKVMLTSDPR
jgi:hypothetical protein